jgi:ABC transporter substrate binding protein
MCLFPSLTIFSLLLESYGTDPVDIVRRSASYVDRIRKGAESGELPVQHPNKLELAINLKNANALGLTVPPAIVRARRQRGAYALNVRGFARDSRASWNKTANMYVIEITT